MARYRQNIIEMSRCLKVKVTFYIDSDITMLGLSVTNENNGQSIVELKTLKLMEFLDENTTIVDVCNTIEEMLKHHSDTILIDPSSGFMREDGIDRLRNFIQSEF
jgi:hypothetical protein